MKKGLLAILALLIAFAMIGCPNNPPEKKGDDITISFDLNGGPGAKPGNVTIAKGGTLGDKYPNITGDATNVFQGWYDGEKKIEANTVLNASVTLKAKWQTFNPDTDIKVSFELGAGVTGVTKPNDVVLTKGQQITQAQIPNPTRTGYTLDGWFNGDTKLAAGQSWQTNVTFTAKWTSTGGGGNLTPRPQTGGPSEPASGYKNYYGTETDPDEWNYTTFAGTGDVGVIVDNEDGTYTVIIKTNPGAYANARSIISFNSDDYTFGKGYYVSVNFPEDTPHKPIMAMTYAAQGINGALGEWSTVHYENTVGSYTPTDPTKYLAGDYSFAWEKEDNVSIYKNLTLELVWSPTESQGEYEFTLKKILITDGESLIPPSYENPSTLTPVSAPQGWVDFDANAAGSTYYPWSNSNSVTKTGASYTVSLATVAAGFSTVTIPLDTGAGVSAGGFYVSVTLPAPATAGGIKLANLIATPKGSAYIWDGETWANRQSGYVAGNYLTGKNDLLWNSIGEEDENTTAITSIELALYWVSSTITDPDPESGVGPQYTFTVNAIKVPDPSGYVPPKPWENFVEFAAGGSKTSGAIAVNWDNRPTAVFNFENGEGKLSEGGFYMSVTFGAESATNAVRPERLLVTAYDSAGDPAPSWASQLILPVTADTMDIYWDGGTGITTQYKKIEVQCQWAQGSTTGVGKTLDVTFSPVKVTKFVESPWDGFVEFAAGGTKTSGAIGPNYDNSYNQAVFNFENGEGKLSQGGFYVSVTFGAASLTNAARPERMLVTAYDSAGVTAGPWASQIIVPVTADTMHLYWDGGAFTTQYKKIEVIGQWDVATADIAGKTLDVTFSPVKVTKFAGPDPWDDFVEFAAGGSKTSGAIAANWDNRPTAVFNFENGEGKLSEGGFYMSVTFGAESATNAVRPERLLVTAYDSAGDPAPSWASQLILPVTADTMDIYWDGGTGITTQYKKIEVQCQWAQGSTTGVGKTLDVTFSPVKVTELVSP